MAKFGSQAWVDSLKADVNVNKDLPKAGKGFDATIGFRVTGAGKKDITFWTHMKDGRVLEAVAGEDANTDYLLTGEYSDWKEIVAGKLDPIQAIMTKKLVFQGDMQVVMRYIKAVNMVMDSVKKVPTEFA